MRSLPASVALLSTLVVLSTAQSYGVPVKFSASVYKVCTVRGRPSSVTLTLEIIKDHNLDFTVNVITRDGTAKRGSDYDAAEVITATFVRRRRSVAIPIPIVTGGDVVELPEYFTVELQLPMETKQKGVTTVSPATARIEIIDVAIGQFSPQNYTVREGNYKQLTILLDRPSMQDTIFNVATISITATTFDDYFRYNYNITVPAGAMAATMTVATARNAKIEVDEHFKAVLHPFAECNNLEVWADTAYVTIIDCTVLVTFSSTMYTATEGMDPKVIVTVLANGAVNESSFSVRVIAKDGTATSGDDYEMKDTLLLFKRGETEHSFSINITDDVLAEPHEVFTLELERPQQSSSVCIARGSPDITHVRLADDDVVTVSFSPQNYTVSEGIPATLGMVLDKEASESITVFVTTTSITAAGSADYVQVNGTPVKIASGATRAALPLLTLRDTEINEPNESLKVTLDLGPTAVRVEVAPNPCFVTITEATVGVNFYSAMYMVGEGDGSFTVTVDASREHAGFDFVIKVVARDGTAEIASDLNDQQVKVTFPAGTKTVDATIGITDDDIAECPEIFDLVLEIPENATGNGVVAIAPNTTEIMIIDNDGVNITFKAFTNYIVREGNSIGLVLEVQGESAKDIMVTVMFTTITAESNDYRDSSGNFTIPAYAREIKITVEALRDTYCDGTEFIKATLSLTQPPSVNVNILLATEYIAIVDATVPVQFQETIVTVEEGECDNLMVTLTALADHDYGFVVFVMIMDGTAERGSDYDAEEVIPVTFHAGQNSTNFFIRIIDNNVAECPEHINLLLEVPENATEMGVVAKEAFTAVVHVTDVWDVVNISFSQMTYTVPESEEVMLKITLDKAPLEDILLTVNTMDITAQSNIDYEQQGINVTIPAGMTTHTVPIQTRENTEKNYNTEFKLMLDLCSNCGTAQLVADTASVIICDTRNVIRFRFKKALYHVLEGLDLNAVIGVVASGRHPGEVVSISVIPKDGTAKYGTDYRETGFILSYPNVPYINYRYVSIINDDMEEFPENFTLELEIPPEAAAECVFKGSPATATVEIIDIVQVIIRPVTTVTEGRHSHAVISLDVVRDCHEDSFSVTLVTKNGSATYDSDYNGTRFPVTIHPGQSKASVRVPIVDDFFLEDPEEFTVELEIPPESAALHVVSGSPDPVPVKIEDDDDRVVYVRFEKSEYSVAEEDKAVEVTVLTDRPVSRPFSVLLRSEHNSTQDSDYKRVSSHVSFRAGQTSATYTLTIYDDRVPEDDEVFVMSLISKDRDVYTQSPDTSKVTIEESDMSTAIRVSFSKANYDVTEGEKPVDITLQALKNHTFPFSVIVSTRDGTASSRSDYSQRRSSVYFQAEVNEVSFTVTIRDDRLAESAEEFYIDLEIPSAAANLGVIEGNIALATVTILNDDDVISVMFNQTTYSVVEGEKSIPITLVAADHSFSFSVYVSTRDGTASSTSDYSRQRRTSVYFRAGVNEVSFTVTIRDEGLVEFDEEFYIELEIPSAAASRSVVKALPDNATVIIQDDDVAIPVRFNQTTYPVNEGERSVSITLEALASHTCSFSVIVSTRDGTASSSSDYSSRRRSVYFRAGVDEVSFTVTIRDEGLVELDEEFYIELEIPSAAATSCSVVKASPDNATVIIRDDDGDKAVAVKFSRTIYRVTEKVKYAAITLQALKNHTFSFSVSVSTRDGTATSADYRLSSSSVTFPARVNEATFRVPIYDDNRVENTEEFYIDLEIPSSSAYNSVIKDPHSPDTARVTITDGTNALRFIASTYKGTEGDSIPVTLVADAITTCLRDYTVYVTSRDGSATSGVDYSALRIPVTFDFEETVKSFTVNIINDSLYENTEDFFLDLEIPPEAVLEGVFKESPASTKIEIVNDDDCVIPVKFGSSIYTVEEKQLSLTGTLETPAYYRRSFTVYVVPHSTNANATGGTDYRSSKIPVTLSSARHVIPFTVTINDDFILEFSEYFFLDLEILTAPPACTVTKASPERAIVHIEDDEYEIPVRFSHATYTVTEGQGVRYVPITLEVLEVRTFSFKVHVSTRDGSAEADKDYRTLDTQITISPRQDSYTFNVQINPDEEPEFPEDFYIDLSVVPDADSRGVLLASPDTAIVVIEDDDLEVEFQLDTLLVVESDDDPENITVLARGDLRTSFTINIIIANITAGGADVTDFTTTDSVTFNAGETETFFPFLASCDTEEEGNEVVRLELQVPEQDRHRISIIGNDHIEVVIVDGCSPNPGQLRDVNDTVFANLIYTVSVLNFTEGSRYNCDTAGYPMCYEVKGKPNKFLNLISDNCVSVNAHYVAAEDPAENVIKAIGVVGTDRANRCHYVNVSVTEDGTCEATVDGVELVNDSIVMYGFAVKHRNRLVRIDAPNCGLGSEHLVMWVHCQRVMGRTMPQNLIKFIINRGLCQRPSAHGLIGQFWGVPTKLEPTTPPGNFILTLYPPGAAKSRTMFAEVYESTWTQMGVPAIPRSSCLYVGSSQAGAHPLTSDTVIEGMWENYTTNSLFDTIFSFSRYRELTCG